jgi:hypothetical protein
MNTHELPRKDAVPTKFWRDLVHDRIKQGKFECILMHCLRYQTTGYQNPDVIPDPVNLQKFEVILIHAVRAGVAAALMNLNRWSKKVPDDHPVCKFQSLAFADWFLRIPLPERHQVLKAPEWSFIKVFFLLQMTHQFFGFPVGLLENLRATILQDANSERAGNEINEETHMWFEKKMTTMFPVEL